MIGSRHYINEVTYHPEVFIGQEPIKRVQVTKSLGVHTEQFLTWENHIGNISKKISGGISAMKKL